MQKNFLKEYTQYFYNNNSMQNMLTFCYSQADAPLLNEHYGDLKKKPFFPGLIKHISSGPVVAMVSSFYQEIRIFKALNNSFLELLDLDYRLKYHFNLDMTRTNNNIQYNSLQYNILQW